MTYNHKHQRGVVKGILTEERKHIIEKMGAVMEMNGTQMKDRQRKEEIMRRKIEKMDQVNLKRGKSEFFQPI